MGNYRIHTTLNVAPNNCSCSSANYIVLVRGASAELTFDFSNYTYLKGDPWYEYLEQVTFLLKNPVNGKVTYYQLFSDDEDEKNYSFIYDEDLDCICLALDAAETATFELADEDSPMEFEVAIDIANDKVPGLENLDSVIIEPQPSIVVKDSLYHSAGLDR